MFFIIGWTIGFYFNIPNNITIEYGENVLTAIHDLKNISFAFNSACKNISCTYYGMPATEQENLACYMGVNYVWDNLFGKNQNIAIGLSGQDVFRHQGFMFCDNLYFDRIDEVKS